MYKYILKEARFVEFLKKQSIIKINISKCLMCISKELHVYVISMHIGACNFAQIKYYCYYKKYLLGHAHISINFVA